VNGDRRKAKRCGTIVRRRRAKSLVRNVCTRSSPSGSVIAFGAVVGADLDGVQDTPTRLVGKTLVIALVERRGGRRRLKKAALRRLLGNLLSLQAPACLQPYEKRGCYGKQKRCGRSLMRFFASTYGEPRDLKPKRRSFPATEKQGACSRAPFLLLLSLLSILHGICRAPVKAFSSEEIDMWIIIPLLWARRGAFAPCLSLGRQRLAITPLLSIR